MKRIYITFLIFWAFIAISYTSIAQVEKLKATLDTTTSPTERINLLSSICWKLRNSDALTAKDYGLKAIEEAKKAEKDTLLVSAYSFTGVTFRNLGYYEEALNYYTKGLDLALKLDIKKQQCYGYINLANLSIYLNQPMKGEQYLRKVATTVQEVNNDNISGYYYLNLGRVMLETTRYRQALIKINKSLEIRNKTGNVIGQSVCKKYIGDVYLKMKKYEKADSIYQEALEIMEKGRDIDLYSATLDGLANAQLLASKIEEANKSALLSLQKAKEINSLLRSKNASETLAKISKHYKNPKNTEKYLKDVIYYKDELYSEDLRRQAETYSFMIKNRELAYEKEKQALQFEAEKKRLFTISVAGGSILLLVIIFGASIYVERRKISLQKQHLARVEQQNTLLEQKVDERTQELHNTNEDLKSLSKYKEELTHMIAHDLKNPLNTIIVLSELKGLSKDKSKHILQAGKTMMDMLSNMLDVQKFQETKISIKPETHSLLQIIKSAKEEVEILLEAKNIHFECKVSQLINVVADKKLMIRVFTNFFTNSIKYTNPNGTIYIDVIKDLTSDRAKINFRDTGNGISQEHIPHIFDKYWQAEAVKSGKIASTGLGLTFCQMAIEAHEGSIEVISQKGEGTKFSFDLLLAPDSTYETYDELEENNDGEKKNITMSDSDKEILKPFIEKLKEIPLYQASEITELLKELDVSSAAMGKWKNDVLNATFNWNEAKYESLLKELEIEDTDSNTIS